MKLIFIWKNFVVFLFVSEIQVFVVEKSGLVFAVVCAVIGVSQRLPFNKGHFQFELKEMQRRDMEEAERRAGTAAGGRRGTPQRKQEAAVGEQVTETTLSVERGPETSDGEVFHVNV